jgi:GNAT superfamily N-acetyltransferase
MKFEIRYLQESDIEAFIPGLKSMWLQHSANHPNLISSSFLENTDIEGYLQNSLRKKEEFVLVAICKDIPVGMMRVEEQELEDFFIHKKCFFLDDAIVLDNYRRRGVATLLMEKAKEIAKKQGIKVLKSRVYTFNHPAIKHLQSQGFDNLYSEYFFKIEEK